jgi:hypothetical protein
MIITKTITKKILESLVQETFLKFGFISSSNLLDSLKLLGFQYATNAGISINIEDLKTPDLKKSYIDDTNNDIRIISEQWQQGFVSENERFQSIIDSWNSATESLKDRIVEYYQEYDPANNLYIMAFSGARGNISQVRQLVGMRGLMSDPQGKIIDLPIQANFREGLSSIDYIISSYGARKGIVDTALKTADAGYLTRRLIYVAQDLVIRQNDCKVQKGILFLIHKKSQVKNLLGRTILSVNSLTKKKDFSNFEGVLLTERITKELKEYSPNLVTLSSSLTCSLPNSICQKCYGWDLAHQKQINLGEAVGIIAAQSIGEPGTQLTMRTFHTGGIFTGELLGQIKTKFSGKLIVPKNLKTISYRTNHGLIVLKIQEEITLELISWQGLKENILLEVGSYLYYPKSSFIRKGQLIAEYPSKSVLPGGRRLKPIYSTFSGEIRFENLLVRKMLREKRTLKVNQDDGVLWISSGKIFPIPKETEYLYPKSLQKKSPFGKLKLITPYEGILTFTKKEIIITSFERKIVLNLSTFEKIFKTLNLQFCIFSKNYQYLDAHTVFGYLYVFPTSEGLIYSLRKKLSKYISTLFFITESDIWKINSDQINNFSFFSDKKAIIRKGAKLSPSLTFNNSGFLLKKDGFQMIFQHAFPIFLARGTILNYKRGDFILEKKVIATLVNYTQQTEDIVQGLPKIEELIEARRPKTKAHLALRPGIFLNPNFFKDYDLMDSTRLFLNDTIKCILLKNKKSLGIFKQQQKKKKKQIIYLIHSLPLTPEIRIFNNKVFKKIELPFGFFPLEKANSKKKGINKEFFFKNSRDQTLLIDKKSSFSKWSLLKKDVDYQNTILFKVEEKGSLKQEENLLGNDKRVYENKRGDLIVLTEENNYIFLEYLNPILEYNLPLTSKVMFETGNFIDIGEPLTEGIIDVHELLNILFHYHLPIDGILFGTSRSLNKFQLILVNSIQAIYQSQGVNISSKHIEIIVKQMSSKVIIKESGDTPFLGGEFISFCFILEICKTFLEQQNPVSYKLPNFEPILRSATNSSLNKDGFLSASGFQETKRVLTKAAIEGSCDWLRGLKECIIIGRLIPAGSAFLNYKHYLDNIYLFKN